MSKDKLAPYLPTAQEALRSFLATLLGNEAPLNLAEPEDTDLEGVDQRSKSFMVLAAGQGPGRFVVLLQQGWLPLLSKSMLGEPIELGEPGADDLLRELAAQAYGALRTQLSGAGVTLPETAFELLEGGADLGAAQLSGSLAEIQFSMPVEGSALGGSVVLPVPQAAAAAPQAGAGAPPRAAAAPAPAAPRAPVDVAPAAFPDLGGELIGGDGGGSLPGGFSLLAEVELEVTVELGRRRLSLADVLRLTTGSVIELEKLVGEPLEVYANGRLIAEGEAVVIDEQFGIRITNLASNRQRAKAFL